VCKSTNRSSSKTPNIWDKNKQPPQIWGHILVKYNEITYDKITRGKGKQHYGYVEVLQIHTWYMKGTVICTLCLKGLIKPPVPPIGGLMASPVLSQHSNPGRLQLQVAEQPRSWCGLAVLHVNGLGRCGK
jgi:hypothetical protein